MIDLDLMTCAVDVVVDVGVVVADAVIDSAAIIFAGDNRRD